MAHLDIGRGTAGADTLAKSTIAIIKNWCTVGFGAPARTHGMELKTTPKLDEDLFKQCKMSLELFNPDNASEETSAGLSLQTGRLGEDAYVAGLKERMCDPMHAAVYIWTFFLIPGVLHSRLPSRHSEKIVFEAWSR